MEDKDNIRNPEIKKQPKPSKKPKWLKALEAQSWQAELLISGLVIAGLLQLPTICVHYLEGYMIDSSPFGFGFLSLASLFFLSGFDILIFFFGIHFLFRGVWIALLGLNSVYPNGINENSTAGSGPTYWKKMKAKYPNLSEFNQELDNRCSSLFSLATIIVIFAFSFSILILIVYKVFQFLVGLFPGLEAYVPAIGIGLYILFTLTALAVGYLSKKYPDNPRAAKFIDKYNIYFYGIFSLFIFHKPLNYITNILASNTTDKRVFLYALVFGFGMGLFGSSHTGNNPIFRNFGSERYFTFNNKPYRTLAYNYENLWEGKTQIFTPMIPSDVVYGRTLKLFIPRIEREVDAMNLDERSLLEKIKNRNSTTFKDSLHQVNLQRYIDFNQIYVNEIPYTGLDFRFYTHPNAGEEGVSAYIPTDDFVVGKNILEIRKNYFSKENTQKIVQIPFYFEGQ